MPTVLRKSPLLWYNTMESFRYQRLCIGFHFRILCCAALLGLALYVPDT